MIQGPGGAAKSAALRLQPGMAHPRVRGELNRLRSTLPSATTVTESALTAGAVRRAGIDVGSGILSAAILTPVITVIDKAVVQNTAGTMRVKDALREGASTFFRNPAKFMVRREARLIAMLYSATYITANLSETHGVSKLATVTPVNMGLCIVKDKAFAAMFGTRAPIALPLACYGLFAARDLMTVGASFNAPKKLSEKVQAHLPVKKEAADVFSQLALPVGVQMLSTPLHVLALDLYNRPGKKATPAQRGSLLRSVYWQTTFTRMARILPAFGVGSMLTGAVRGSLLGRFGGD